MQSCFNGVIDAITGLCEPQRPGVAKGAACKVEGRVVLMKKYVLDFNDFNASVLDDVKELLGRRVSLQLISSVNGDPGKLGSPAYLEEWLSTGTPLLAGETAYRVAFDWDEEIGLPGAFTIRNQHHSEFYLKTLTVYDVPGHDVPGHDGSVHFVCNSWVYPAKKYNKDRVFFANKTYLPDQTPSPLVKYREEELKILRGNGKGERQEWERVYDYDVYNDLGEPDKGPSHARPILGGSVQYPYPRRGRTGRPPTKKDPKTESRLPQITSQSIYVPRDEMFGHLKTSDFQADIVKAVVQIIHPVLKSVFDDKHSTPLEFDSFDDVISMYKGGIKLSDVSFINNVKKDVHLELLKELLTSDGAGGILKYSIPQVIKEDNTAWSTDEEFAREMVAGVNPLVIRRLGEFPPTSTLDREVYGNQTSSITKEHIEHGLDGLTVDEAIEKNRLFILDHHDAIMPYLRRIIATSSKTYATRTVLFLKDDGTLKPLAIVLSLPHPEGDQLGAVSKVFTPAPEGGVAGSIWQLAKAYVGINDSGNHQLISHFLNTHAVIEPFIIASNRQLSALHPIYKLLHPHFRGTMYINALARQVLISAGGVVESIFFPEKYSMELSSVVYKNWVFPEQALPADLIKRGLAVEDETCPHGLRLLIEDFPYAVDGLEIWSSIKAWVEDYCSVYYKSDEMVQGDSELQAWWKELVEVGHGDKKDEPWWPKMDSRKSLMDTCSTVIWVASALHAAVNFGQYPYAGYVPNRPTTSRRYMPEEGTDEFEELKKDPERTFLKTITSALPSLLDISVIEILSKHSSDEVYLGTRDTAEWTADKPALEAFERFGRELEAVQERITGRNADPRWKNRSGPAKVPYTLLYPTSEGGLTGKGIPNSVSI